MTAANTALVSVALLSFYFGGQNYRFCAIITRGEKKCLTGQAQRFICTELTSYKIHILVEATKKMEFNSIEEIIHNCG